jgi:altronate hydrolase
VERRLHRRSRTQINGVVSLQQHGGLANIFENRWVHHEGGTGPLNAVYRYAEPVTGAVASWTRRAMTRARPPVSAGGANMIMFTTGRGSMFGAKPVPSIKLATNTPMFTKLEEDMDINCGEILDGTVSLSGKAQQIFDLMLRIASGEKTKSELLGLGDHEYVPWNIGVTG